MLRYVYFTVKSFAATLTTIPSGLTTNDVLVDGDPNTCSSLAPTNTQSWGYQLYCTDLTDIVVTYDLNCDDDAMVFIVGRDVSPNLIFFLNSIFGVENF